VVKSRGCPDIQVACTCGMHLWHGSYISRSPPHPIPSHPILTCQIYTSCPQTGFVCLPKTASRHVRGGLMVSGFGGLSSATISSLSVFLCAPLSLFTPSPTVITTGEISGLVAVLWKSNREPEVLPCLLSPTIGLELVGLWSWFLRMSIARAVE